MAKLNRQLSVTFKTLTGFILVALIINSCGIEQEKEMLPANIPQAVISSFEKQYPGIDEVKWYFKKTDDLIIYKAKWIKEEKQMEKQFDANGNDYIEYKKSKLDDL